MNPVETKMPPRAKKSTALTASVADLVNERSNAPPPLSLNALAQEPEMPKLESVGAAHFIDPVPVKQEDVAHVQTAPQQEEPAVDGALLLVGIVVGVGIGFGLAYVLKKAIAPTVLPSVPSVLPNYSSAGV